MYFIPRDTKFYSFVVTLRPLYRYGLTLLVLSVLLSLWFIALYSKVGAAITQYHAQCTQYKQQQTMVERVTKECKKLKKSVASLRRNIQRHITAKTPDEQFQDAVSFIIQQADACALSLNACSVQSEEQKSWRTNYTVAFDYSGPYSQIMNFFDSLSSSKKWFNAIKYT